MTNLLVNILRLASLVFIARALLSWFRVDPDSGFYPVVRAINQITEPVLAPIRNFMPRTGGFDFSVLVVIFGINLLLIPIVSSF